MDAKTIALEYKVQHPEPLLWEDWERVMRATPFRKTGDDWFDMQAIVCWWMDIYIPNSRETDYQTVWRTWDRAVWNYFKYIRPGGYVIATNQSHIRLSCHRNQPIEDHIKELNIWLPYVKPVEDDEGILHKNISIFEHTLSEYGCYDLLIYPDSYKLQKITYHRPRILATWPTLEEAAKYIHTHHYYE